MLHFHHISKLLPAQDEFPAATETSRTVSEDQECRRHEDIEDDELLLVQCGGDVLCVPGNPEIGEGPVLALG